MAGPGSGLTLPGPHLEEEEGGKKVKMPPSVMPETFPADETPTPTRILKMADMDLFGELKDSGQYSGKENPFDAHFRKAAEAVKQGADNLTASVSATELQEESLNTPQIYCGETPQPSTSLPFSRPIILKVHPTPAHLPTATVAPALKAYKPIAPSPLSLPPTSPNSSALLLLKFPSGETVKLSNLPISLPGPQPSATPTLTPTTKTKLKQSLALSNVQVHQGTITTEERERGREEVEGDEGERREQKERNRMSAQRSRQRKRLQSDSLRQESQGVTNENAKLLAENARLKLQVG